MRQGRPTRLTEVLILRIAEHVRNGCSGSQAAKFEGVGRSTFHEWRQRGESEPDSIFAKLCEAIEQAESEVYKDAVKVVINGMADPDPRVRLQCARLWLERRHPEEWAPRANLQHSGHDGGAVQILAQLAPLLPALQEHVRQHDAALLASELPVAAAQLGDSLGAKPVEMLSPEAFEESLRDVPPEPSRRTAKR